MDAEHAKRAAGEAAANLVGDGFRVGLGTGSTARWFILALGRRAHDGLRVSGIATSVESEELAASCGIPLRPLDAGGLDLAVDGADVVDPELRLIKGGGGAMVREKVVATAARRFVVVVDWTKVRSVLAGMLPVELIPFGALHTLRLLDATGGAYRVRIDDTGAPVRSDNGNLLADGAYERIDDPEGLAAQLDAIPGLVGHGLFLGLTDTVIVGEQDGSVRRLPADA